MYSWSLYIWASILGRSNQRHPRRPSYFSFLHFSFLLFISSHFLLKTFYYFFETLNQPPAEDGVLLEAKCSIWTLLSHNTRRLLVWNDLICTAGPALNPQILQKATVSQGSRTITNFLLKSLRHPTLGPKAALIIDNIHHIFLVLPCNQIWGCCSLSLFYLEDQLPI